MIQQRRKPASIPRNIRVAIYCRQSVDDSTNEFGSIQAQREAVASYVASQRGEGWVALPEHYDDGGFSGKNTQRPAFQRLLADVDAGRLDVVAVYKLDRLSRSLSDFVELMARFRERNVEFVSVTQQFTTTSSVGRMTLNLLATFAEFEREQISERTRDKMLAARRRGMWTGGPVPLGFDLIEKRLVVNEPEAVQVRALFAAYVETRSLTKTIEVAAARGIRAKSWTTKDGRVMTGSAFNKSTLAKLLSNVVYIGKQTAGDEVVGALHPAIVPSETWDAAAALLRSNRDDGGAQTKNRHGALLRCLIKCAVCGSTMHFTSGGGVRYYACRKVLKESASACPGSRVPVALIEPAVVERIRAIGRDPQLVEATIAAARREHDARVPELEADAKRLDASIVLKDRERAKLIAAIASGGPASLTADVEAIDAEIETLTAQADHARDEAALLRAHQIDEGELRRVLADFDALWASMLVRDRERVLRLLVTSLSFDGRSGAVELNDARFTLPIRKARDAREPQSRNAPRRGIRGARLLALAHHVEREIERGHIGDLAHAAELFGLSRARMSQVAQLAELAPDLQERLLNGDENIHERLIRAALRSVDWDDQRAAIGA